ncbi:ABC transporter family substrate-binding protein [Pseudactinotalea sp. Z1748]|uniref:ABC transporter family substrate-binding protein n=1 Tax=Pseudactinotalea sp. Z1748 TaxID=3413027 RepID=UPI003C7D6223
MREMKRKRLLVPAALLTASALVLAGCGNGGDGTGGGSGGGGDTDPAEGAATYDMDAVYDINEQPRENLQEGGQLTIPMGGMGPNWNVAAVDGYYGSTLDIMATMHNISAWKSDPLGQPVLHTDYFLNIEEEFEEDGTQILHYELNPEAVWNDGTPIDFYTYEHTVAMNQHEDFDAVASALFNRVESIEMGEDEWSFTVTMAEVQKPITSLFAAYSMVHPDVTDADEFNEGFVNDLKPDYRAGPFILDIYDRAANTVSVVPNPNWWGEEPVLDRINFVQFEASATIQAFQNEQTDAVQINNYDRYSEVTNWREPGDGYQIRRGQHIGDGGFLFNADARNLDDVEVRKAIFQAIDREQLAEVRFQGLNWEEEMPGSWLLMPFDPRYQDNYPVEDADPAGARETLEAAGWTGEEGEIVTNEAGEPLTVQLSTFGDDPTESAIAQSFQTMMREAGIDVEIFNRGAGEFSEAMNTQDFGIVMSGYTKGGADPTSGPGWFWGCDYTPTGVCDDDIDEWVAALPTILDDDERALETLRIEQEAISRHFHFLIYYNGPNIWAYRDGLANYGPRLFETVDWTKVGWEADAGHDGTDTGVDVDDLDEDSEADEEDDS